MELFSVIKKPWLCRTSQVGETIKNLTLPCCSELISGTDLSVPLFIGEIRIFHASSINILLYAKFGLQIQIQRLPVMQVYISLENSYKNKTKGRFDITFEVTQLYLRITFQITTENSLTLTQFRVQAFDVSTMSFRFMWYLQRCL